MARERSYGASLARVSEVLLYARIPVRRFIDIGTGAGYLLDALGWFLPSAKEIFHGVEKFPPKEGHSDHPNYVVGSLGDAPGKFQAGCCIEVIEHLTPKMLRQLFVELKEKSEKKSIYIFNSGSPEYVKHEEREYLDPLGRGHVISYSLKAIEILAGDLGFTVWPIKGKTWAFLLEYKPGFLKNSHLDSHLASRVWTVPRENLDILCDPVTGAVFLELGMESARESVVVVKKQNALLREEVTRRDSGIGKLQNALVEREQQIAALECALAERDRQIDAIQNSTFWRITKPLRAVRRMLQTNT